MKRLLIILGAGTSSALGMGSVCDLGRCMRGWAANWACAGKRDYFNGTWRSMESYYAAGDGVRPAANFEKVLGDLIALAHWEAPPPWGNSLRRAACGAAPQGRGHSLETELYDQARHLLEKLACHVRAQCRGLDWAAAAAKRYRRLIQGLSEGFDLGVYSLNYDDAALRAVPNAETGFDRHGSFNPASVHRFPERNLVYHLHGSVHHSLDREGGKTIVWREDLARSDFHDSGLPQQRDSDRVLLPITTLTAGGFKLNQTLREPFSSLRAAFVRDASSADAILIAGYGFGDAHVNRVLENRLSDPRRRPPVMIIDLCEDAPQKFQREDLWAWEASRVFGVSPPLLPPDEGAFAVAGIPSLGLWYGGFLDAESHLPEIMGWLEGSAGSIRPPGRS